MPAHRKILPQHCPICGKNYGTMQMVYFGSSRSLVFRIGHYSKKRYKSARSEYLRHRKAENYRKKIRSQQKVWHSFRSSVTRDLEEKYERHYGYTKIIKTIPPPLAIIRKIKKSGWEVLPNSSWNYRGRERENIEYDEEIQKILDRFNISNI
jgi:hypothetical protein